MNKPYIKAVMAADEANAIGKAGGLPWHLPDDLKRFKAHTVGMPIVMGRRTWESFGGKPLPNRHNIVVSKTLSQSDLPEGATVVKSWQAALEACGNEDRVALIGGAQLLREGFNDVNELILTRVHTRLAGSDTFLHAWPNQLFVPQGEPTHHPVDDKHDYAFTEVRWLRQS